MKTKCDLVVVKKTGKTVVESKTQNGIERKKRIFVKFNKLQALKKICI